MEKRLFAIRGATGALNTARDIEERVATLHDAMLARNGISEDDVVSIIFSITPDLTSRNPAAALRQSGRASKIPLFCTAEPLTDDAPASLIRVLVHYHAPINHTPTFVYLNGAQSLRPDLNDITAP